MSMESLSCSHSTLPSIIGHSRLSDTSHLCLLKIATILINSEENFVHV
jgi:hypothetical protein